MPPWRSRSSTKPSRTLAALDVRDFRLLYIALFGTSVSYQLQRTIELWLVYDLTGSPLLTGFTGLVRGLATLVFQLAGGVVADRIDRRRFVILVQCVNAVITLSLGTLALTGLIQVWHLFLAAFVNSTLTTAAGPARTAMVPGLVPRELLVNAFAQIASVRKLSQLVGPAVGGVLIGFAGSGWTYAVACLIYIVSIPIMVCMRYESGPLDREQSPVKSLLEGIDFIRRNSLIVGLLVTEFAAVFFGSYRALLPIFAVAMGLGPEGLGILLAAPALGSLPGVAAVMWLGNISYKGLFIAFSVIAYAGCLFRAGVLDLVSRVGGDPVPGGRLRCPASRGAPGRDPGPHPGQPERARRELPAHTGRGRSVPGRGPLRSRRRPHRRPLDVGRDRGSMHWDHRGVGGEAA